MTNLSPTPAEALEAAAKICAEFAADEREVAKTSIVGGTMAEVRGNCYQRAADAIRAYAARLVPTPEGDEHMLCSKCGGYGNLGDCSRCKGSGREPSPSTAEALARALEAFAPIAEDACKLIAVMGDNKQFPPTMSQDHIDAYRDGMGWGNVLNTYHLWPPVRAALLAYREAHRASAAGQEEGGECKHPNYDWNLHGPGRAKAKRNCSDCGVFMWDAGD